MGTSTSFADTRPRGERSERCQVAETMNYCDEYFIGKLNYVPTPKGYYKVRLPELIDFMNKHGVKYKLKKELLEEMEK